MRFEKYIFLIFLVTGCNSNSGPKNDTAKNLVINNQFHPILVEGAYKASYHCNKEITIAQSRILKKVDSILKVKNYDQDFLNQIINGGKPLYNTKLGISNNDYLILLDIFSLEKQQIQTGSLVIKREGDYIKFQGEGQLAILDSVFLNLKSKSVIYKNIILNQNSDSLDFSNEDIPKGDSLKSYEFYRGPDGILGLTGLNGSFELLIGRLEPSGKIYISFFAKEADNPLKPIPDFITAYIGKL